MAASSILLAGIGSALFVAVRASDSAAAPSETIAACTIANQFASELRYAVGIDSYLDVLDAQRSLYAARQALVSLQRAKLSGQVRLYAALGGGGGRTDNEPDQLR